MIQVPYISSLALDVSLKDGIISHQIKYIARI